MRPPMLGLPHRTILPGLQFMLAGIVGKPETYYRLPAVRFAFEIWSYIGMVAIYCSCVIIEDKDEIPAEEWAFYVFILGLIWRDTLEFRELLPVQRILYSRYGPSRIGKTIATPENKYMPERLWKLWNRRTLTPSHSMAKTLQRYLFYDAWNILDASTAALAMLALIFRIIGQQGATESESVVGENALNIAQWCFLFSAPFLFSRVLFLSQIDDTLGPMTQVHDTMLVRRERESQPICVEGGAIGLKR